MSQQALPIPVNDIYIPEISRDCRYLILFGGAGSGKSFFAAQKIVLRTLTEENHRFLIIRKVARTMRRSVFQIVLDTIWQFGVRNEFEVNKTEMTITHKDTGNEIIFAGVDDPEKLKSITGVTGIWVEEATELQEEDFDQVDIRLRGQTKNYKQIVLTFNPVRETHWIKNRFFDNKVDNSHILKSTYEHNHFLDEEYKDVLNSKAEINRNFYRVYKLGEWGVAEVDRPYMYNFDDQKHVGNAKINTTYPIRLIFDFNIDPFVCLVMQMYTEGGKHKIRFFDEIVLNNGDIDTMITRIKSKYDQYLTAALITGDATGRNRNVGTKADAWMQVCKGLGINPNSSRMQVPRSNPKVADNQFLCNAILARHGDCIFDKEMKLTINEMLFTECDADGNILKKNRDKEEQRGDALDCVRYAFNAWLYDFIDNPAKYGY